MSNGIDPSVLQQFQANGWVPPTPATAVNLAPPPGASPVVPENLTTTGDIYGSQSMQSAIAALPTPAYNPQMPRAGKQSMGSEPDSPASTAAADEGGAAPIEEAGGAGAATGGGASSLGAAAAGGV